MKGEKTQAGPVKVKGKGKGKGFDFILDNLEVKGNIVVRDKNGNVKRNLKVTRIDDATTNSNA